MIRPNEPMTLMLKVDEINVVLAGLQELPFKVAAPVIERLRQQILAVDPEAFSAPQINGASAVPN
jgi:hypothetical protein